MPDGECNPADRQSCECIKVEALIKVDERGQMVLPKGVREKAGIRTGERLALTTIESNGKFCCILLTKADALVGVMRSALGTVTRELEEDSVRRSELDE
jgi:antitoxin PrlF